MKAGKGTRGRPKGTGINDKELLLRIAAIIVDNPDIKRTTAIKRLGIENPSTVRRLRDKFQAEADKYIAEVKASRAPAQGGAETAKGRKPKAAPEPAAPAQQAAAAASAPQGAGDSIQIEALVTGLICQFLGVKPEAMPNHPILALVRQNVQLIETMLPIVRTQFQTVQRLAQQAA
jgi:hypothetical protein